MKKIHKRRPPIKIGDILREIEDEGKGKNWKIPILFFLRKEQTEENIQKVLERLQLRVTKWRNRHPNETFPEPTREDALAYLPFPRYTNATKGVQRRYYKAEARELKALIKKVRKYT